MYSDLREALDNLDKWAKPTNVSQLVTAATSPKIYREPKGISYLTLSL
jgi:hypothetical protein